MQSLPLTTKILIALLILVSARFVWTITSNSSPQPIAPTQKSVPTIDKILTCDQYKSQIHSCTEQATLCLQQIAISKKFHQDNEQKIKECQSNNEKNLKHNQQLRLKLSAVSQRLDELLSKRKPSTTQNIQTTSEL